MWAQVSKKFWNFSDLFEQCFKAPANNVLKRLLHAGGRPRGNEKPFMVLHPRCDVAPAFSFRFLPNSDATAAE
jgi:hypothetical protein